MDLEKEEGSKSMRRQSTKFNAMFKEKIREFLKKDKEEMKKY